MGKQGLTVINNIDLVKGANVISNGCTAFENGVITYAGPSEPERPDLKAGQASIIDGRGKLAIPGLVNAHTHSPMTLLRNFADDLAFSDWLFGRIMPTEDLMTAEDMYWGASLAIGEMLKSGTTAFLDMYMYMDTIAQLVNDTGMRANISKDVLKSAARAGEVKINKDRFMEFYNTWNGKGDGRIQVSMEVHSVYLYDEPSLRAAAEIAQS